MNSLARELQGAGRLDEAESLYREALAILRKETGDVHRNLAVNLSLLARLLAEKGEDGEAEALHEQACAMFDEVYGTAHWIAGYCRNVYGAFLTGRALYDEAQDLLLAAYPVLHDALGPEHRRTRRALHHLVQLYEAWGKPDKAAEYRALLPEEEDGES